MTDKTAKGRKSKGRQYCDTPGTSCYYDEQDVCVNCERPKGWRKAVMPRIEDEARKMREEELREAVSIIKDDAYYAWTDFCEALTTLRLVWPNPSASYSDTLLWYQYLGDEGERFMRWFDWDALEQRETAKCPYCGQVFYALPQHDPIKLHVQYCEKLP